MTALTDVHSIICNFFECGLVSMNRLILRCFSQYVGFLFILLHKSIRKNKNKQKIVILTLRLEHSW